MPALDLSELTFDPDFCESFTVMRRTETIDAHGRSVITSTALTAFGSIQSKDTAIGGNTLERGPDEQHRGAALDVYTNFRLQSATVGRQADLVMYDGDPYVVILINDYSHYGAGFIHAECTSIPSMDAAPIPIP